MKMALNNTLLCFLLLSLICVCCLQVSAVPLESKFEDDGISLSQGNGRSLNKLMRKVCPFCVDGTNNNEGCNENCQGGGFSGGSCKNDQCECSFSSPRTSIVFDP